MELLITLIPVLMPLIKELINKPQDERKRVAALYHKAAVASGNPLAEAICSSVFCIADKWTTQQFQSFQSAIENVEKVLKK